MTRFAQFMLFMLLLLAGISATAQEDSQQPNLITGWDGDLQVLLWRPYAEELTIVTTARRYNYNIDQPSRQPFAESDGPSTPSLTWAPDGRYLLIDLDRSGIALIDRNLSDPNPDRYLGLPNANCPVTWYPDGEQLLAAAGSDVVRWNWKTDEIERHIMDFRNWMEFLALSEDGHTVYVRYGVHRSHDEQGIYDLETETWILDDGFYIGNFVESSPYNRCTPQFASVLQQNRRMLEAPAGQVTPPAPSVTGVPTYPTVILDHQMPAETTLLYHILHTGSLEGTEFPPFWQALSISPHKDAIVIAHNGIHRVIVYQAGTYVQVATLIPEDVGLGDVQQLAWASDGCRIAVGDSDSIYIWHLDAEALGCE